MPSAANIPDISLCGENSVEKRFRWHPLYGKNSTTTFAVVVRTTQQHSRQTTSVSQRHHLSLS